MKRWIFLLAAFVPFVHFSAQASGLPDATNAAQRLTSLSVHEELAESDPRVVATAASLNKLSKLTGEEQMAIAAACTRYSRYLFDAAKIRATPLELLDGLERFAAKNVPVNDTLQRYVAARQNAPGKTHAETMAALGRK